MSLQAVLIAGKWRSSQNPTDSFTTTNPTTETPLPDQYPVSGLKDVERALQAGQEAVTALRALAPDDIARFLERFAHNIGAGAEALVDMAHLETGLPVEPRLRSVELPRTTDQLWQAADAARGRSWCQAKIDTKSNIRTKYGHPGFTAVGIPASLLRFAALHCYDNVRHHRLPLELRDKNPTGQMWRFIDGEWTQRDV